MLVHKPHKIDAKKTSFAGEDREWTKEPLQSTTSYAKGTAGPVAHDTTTAQQVDAQTPTTRLMVADDDSKQGY